MASYASWTDTAAKRPWGKMHGNRYLLTDVLKQRLGFDGFVVSDWNGIEQVPGCTKSHCPQAINAGIDLVMVPDDWKAFIANTVADVRSGAIPMARIDDAVSRIVARQAAQRPVRRVSGHRAPSARIGDQRSRVARARPRGGPEVAGASQERARRAAAFAEAGGCSWSVPAPTAWRTRPAAGH